MNPTHILTDIENNNGRIYLVSNRTHGYSTILPLAESNFISFLEELYTIIEVDDYEISYKYLAEANLKNKIISYLHNIFKTDTLTFAINNTVSRDVPLFFETAASASASSTSGVADGSRAGKGSAIRIFKDVAAAIAAITAVADGSVLGKFEIIDVTNVTQDLAVTNNTSNDFFIYLNQLLVNHIRNDELLKKFKLLEPEKPIMKNNDAKQKNTICDILKSSKSPDNIIKPNTVEKETVKDKETILPYNYYESLKNNTEDTVYNVVPYESDTTFASTLQYSPWKADESNKNVVCDDNCNKCTILYCISQSIGIVIENQNTIFVEYLTKNFKDFELVKTYSKLNIKELENIKNYFHKRDFESNEIILKKINSFEFLFDMNNDKKHDTVSNEIEKFIRERYTINNEPKNMMKANEILGQLIIELQIFNKDKMKLAKELSSILLNMGLKKKRMADGIYYYGIVSKQNLFLSSVGNIEEMYKKTVEEHKLESISEILTQLKSSCKSRNGPCSCLDVKGCDRVVVVVPNQ
jgi:hypothetical protein